MLFRNIAGQKLPLFLQDSSGVPKTGEAANITAYVSVDGGAGQTVSPVTEIGGGWYYIAPSAAQTNGHLITWWGTHATYLCRGGAAFSTLDYTQARATMLDNLDATVTSRAPAATALSTAVWTDVKAGYLDVAISSRSSHTPADVWGYSSRTLTAFGFNVDVNMDQALPGTPTANTTGEALKFADTRLDATVSSRAPAATALSSSVWTDTRAAKLDNLDTTVSSRSSHTPADVWSYSSRTLTAAVDVNMAQTLPTSPGTNTTGEALKFADTRLDATVSSRAPASTALSNATWTDLRAAKLDNLDTPVSSRSSHTPADVWSYGSRSLTTFTFAVDVNMGQTLPTNPAAGTTGEALKFADTRLDAAVSTRLPTAGYTAPDNAGIAAVKSQTDKLAFAGTGPYDVKATLDGEQVTLQTSSITDIWTQAAVEAGLNPLQALSVIAAACAGVLSGASTTQITIKGAGTAATRITANVDAAGNRLAVQLTPP